MTTQGKDAFRESTRDWLSVWKEIELETDHVEAFGDRVVARGALAHDRPGERSGGHDADSHGPHGPGWENRST